MAKCQNLERDDSTLGHIVENELLLNSGNYQIVNNTKRQSQQLESEDDDVIIEVDSEFFLRVPQTASSKAPPEVRTSDLKEEIAPLENSDIIEKVKTSCTVTSKRKRKANEEEEVEMNLTHLFSGKLLRGNAHFARRLQITTRTERATPKIKHTKKLPNHFVAIQISDAEIVKRIEDIQSCVIDREPRLKSALIHPPTLHITLAVMHLSCNEEVERTFEAIQTTCASFKDGFLADPLHLHFEDLSHFKNKVLYGCIQHNERLHQFAQSLRDKIKETGVELADDGKFTPHLTVMKLSKDPRLFRKGVKQIHPRLYEEHAKGRIGSQLAAGVQLLSMTDRKDSNGYYASKGEFRFFAECASLAEPPRIPAMVTQFTETRLEIRDKIKQLTTSVVESIKV